MSLKPDNSWGSPCLLHSHMWRRDTAADGGSAPKLCTLGACLKFQYLGMITLGSEAVGVLNRQDLQGLCWGKMQRGLFNNLLQIQRHFKRNLDFDISEFIEMKLFQRKHFSQPTSFDKTKLWPWKRRICRRFSRESNTNLNYCKSHSKCKDTAITVETVKAEQKGILQANYWEKLHRWMRTRMLCTFRRLISRSSYFPSSHYGYNQLKWKVHSTPWVQLALAWPHEGHLLLHDQASTWEW